MRPEISSDKTERQINSTLFRASYRQREPVRMFNSFAGTSRLDHDPKEAQCTGEVIKNRDEYSTNLRISLSADCNIEGIRYLRDCILSVVDQIEKAISNPRPDPPKGGDYEI